MCVTFVTCDVSCGVTGAGMQVVACTLVRTFVCVCVRVIHTHSRRTVTLHCKMVLSNRSLVFVVHLCRPVAV